MFFLYRSKVMACQRRSVSPRAMRVTGKERVEIMKNVRLRFAEIKENTK